MSEQEIETVIVAVLAKILKRTEASIRTDERHYAAYHLDDGFIETYADQIDWASGTFIGPDEVASPFWARADFDDAGCVVYDDSVEPTELEDGPLKDYVTPVEGHLYLSQIGELVTAGHIEICELPIFYGKIRSGKTLIEAATHLMMLHQAPLEFTSDYYEVDAEWEDMVKQITCASLAHHIGIYFQDSHVARCFGAHFKGKNANTWDSLRDIEPVACWSLGEGEGAFCLARVHNAIIQPVPDLGEPIIKTVIVVSDEDRERFSIATNNQHDASERLDAIGLLLDHFDDLCKEHQSGIINVLSNPWTQAPSKAVECIGRAIILCREQWPHTVRTMLFQQAFSADVAGDQKRSIELYTELIELHPDEGMYWYNRACEYGYLGMADEAISDLAKAVSLAPWWAARAAKSDHMRLVKDDPRFQKLVKETEI